MENVSPPLVPPVAFDAPVVERGVGFFETLLLVGHRAVLWDAHVERLLGTLRRLALPYPEKDELARHACRAMQADPLARLGATVERALRLSWIAVGSDLEEASAWRLDVTTRAIPEATLRRRGGSNAFTLPSELRRDTPTMKSTSYLAAVLGLRHARQRGGDEGFFVASDDTYLEGTSTALVAWNGGRLACAPAVVLAGVTAAAFVDAAVERRPLTRADLRAGAVVLGALTLAAPLRTLDGEACALPEAMLARVAAFNSHLVQVSASSLDAIPL